ncbi:MULTISPECIES: DUF6281 family protein [unclassified Streptomyces]|uniref:DUF6281 family protein n=1 Tax=unclassified Streptomyces TaxID=2593676 RepID=UPI0036EBB8F1
MKASPTRVDHGPARALLAVTLLSLSVGCTAASPDDEAQPQASCAYVIEYDSRRYLGREVTDVPVGESLGSATRPACDDTPGDGDDGEGPVLMTAFALRGVDPAVAIAVAEDPGAYRLAVADSVKELPPALRKMTDGS